MRRAIITLGSAVACLIAGAAQAAVGTPVPRAFQLAHEIAAEDTAPTWSKAGPAVEQILSRGVVQALGVTDAAETRKINVLMHASVADLEGDMVNARASALAATFGVTELEDMLAFRRSDAGQALSRAAPELTLEIMAAFTSQTPSTDDPPQSEQKRRLIRRILTAQEAESRARKMWRMIHAGLAQTTLEQGETDASPGAPKAVNDQKAEDDYVLRVLVVEQGFYAKTLSDDQLSHFAAYLEGPAGRAAVERAPQLARLGGAEVPGIFERRFAQIEQASCGAVACAPSQRKALEAQLDQVRSVVTAAANALGQ